MSEYREGVLALWRAVFGQPPPLSTDPDLLLRLLVHHLPAAPPYGRENQAAQEPIRDAG